MKLTQLMKENEERPLSNEVKRHFLEIVSTYNKYQESMDRKSDITQVAETLGGITEAARTLAIKEAGDWFDKHTVKRNMSELDKLGKQFDKVALEARALDQRMAGLYEDMGHILSRYYKFGEITEDQMKERLGINETKEEDCGCNSINESVNEARTVSKPIKVDNDTMVQIVGDNKGFRELTAALNPKTGKPIQKFGFDRGNETAKSKEELIKKLQKKYGKSIKFESVNEQSVTVHNRTSNGNIVTTLKESDLNEEEMKLYEFGKKVESLMEKNCPTDSSKWSSYKSQAKKKFDVYPSAYANGWAAKKYKAAGGGWKKC
jgi:hypothetical protein